MTVLVTGSVGFIGFHLCRRLLFEGTSVVGFDNFNDYYDPALKIARSNELDIIADKTATKYTLIKGDLENATLLEEVFDAHGPNIVVNLAAQAGVRYSIENPSIYIQSNLVGFGNILEGCRKYNINHLIYASSSSVYGGNKSYPFSEKQGTNHPVSLYAASKRANEIMAHTYSHLYELPTTGLRFFTVYGPWGRPDMALFKFTKAMLENNSIEVFNHGKMVRDFTYIDDIIEGIIRVINKPPEPNPSFDYLTQDPSSSWSPFRIFNIGNSSPITLIDYINALELALGITAKKVFLPMQPGDVEFTSADISALENWIGFKPSTSVNEGISKFVEWYRAFYKV